MNGAGRLWLLMALLVASSALASTLWLKEQQFSARLLLCLLVLLAALWQLWRHYQSPQHATRRLLQALANADLSMQDQQQPETAALLAQIRQQLLSAREQAEARASYLQTLLSQLDIAVLRLSEQGELLEQNPAAERLLLHSGAALWPQLRVLLLSKPQASQTLQLPDDVLAVSLVRTRLLGQWSYLLTLQSIRTPLQQQQVLAYQQLLRVLNHEMANSITPMTSLTESVGQLLLQPDAADLQDAREALSTVQQRGQHLLQFLAQFRSLSQPVHCQLRYLPLRPAVEQGLKLLQGQYPRLCWQWQAAELPPSQAAWFDPALLEQVVLNLATNAVQAMLLPPTAEPTVPTPQEAPGQGPLQLDFQLQLDLQLQLAEGRLWLDIADQGPGISDSAQSSLFTPFFTTKAKGSGIGLALSRQLMQAMGGELRLHRAQPSACFRLELSA